MERCNSSDLTRSDGICSVANERGSDTTTNAGLEIRGFGSVIVIVVAANDVPPLPLDPPLVIGVISISSLLSGDEIYGCTTDDDFGDDVEIDKLVTIRSTPTFAEVLGGNPVEDKDIMDDEEVVRPSGNASTELPG